MYALIALSPIVYYAAVQSSGFLSASELAVLAPGRRYAGWGAIYFGCAALASFFLCIRSRLVVWPAAAIVVWVAAIQLWSLPASWQDQEATVHIAQAAVLAGLALLAWFVLRLRQRGTLR